MHTRQPIVGEKVGWQVHHRNIGLHHRMFTPLHHSLDRAGMVSPVAGWLQNQAGNAGI